MGELNWEGPEFEYHEKGPFWEATVVIIAAIFIVLALIVQKNFLFAVFIALSAGIMIFWGRRRPPIVVGTIDDGGVVIKDRAAYHFSELSEYAISPYPVTGNNDQFFVELVLHRKGAIRGPVKIFLPGELVNEAREQLQAYLPEFDYEPSLSEQISRLLRF